MTDVGAWFGVKFYYVNQEQTEVGFLGGRKIGVEGAKKQSPLPHSLLLAIKKQGKKGNPVRVTNTVLNIYLS